MNVSTVVPSMCKITHSPFLKQTADEARSTGCCTKFTHECRFVWFYSFGNTRSCSTSSRMYTSHLCFTVCRSVLCPVLFQVSMVDSRLCGSGPTCLKLFKVLLDPHSYVQKCWCHVTLLILYIDCMSGWTRQFPLRTVWVKFPTDCKAPWDKL